MKIHVGAFTGGAAATSNCAGTVDSPNALAIITTTPSQCTEHIKNEILNNN